MPSPPARSSRTTNPSMDRLLERARVLVDAAHAADPHRGPDGRAAELSYADGMERWALRISPDASPLLLLAARCQHLERWLVPRASFPEGKEGYHAWRRSLYLKQSERARQTPARPRGFPRRTPTMRRPGSARRDFRAIPARSASRTRPSSSSLRARSRRSLPSTRTTRARSLSISCARPGKR